MILRVEFIENTNLRNKKELEALNKIKMKPLIRFYSVVISDTKINVIKSGKTLHYQIENSLYC